MDLKVIILNINKNTLTHTHTHTHTHTYIYIYYCIYIYITLYIYKVHVAKARPLNICNKIKSYVQLKILNVSMPVVHIYIYIFIYYIYTYICLMKMPTAEMDFYLRYCKCFEWNCFCNQVVSHISVLILRPSSWFQLPPSSQLPSTHLHDLHQHL